MIGHLYKITGPNGKSYIGITSKTVEKRWKTHLAMARSGRKGPLYTAIRKYGLVAFQIQPLLVASWEDINFYEEKAITLFKTLSPAGYNLLSGGSQPRQHPDSIRRTAVKLKQRWQDPIFRIKMTRRRRGVGMLGKKHSQETRSKISTNRKGKNIGKEATKRQSETLRQRWQDPVFREMMLAARRKSCG